MNHTLDFIVKKRKGSFNDYLDNELDEINRKAFKLQLSESEYYDYLKKGLIIGGGSVALIFGVPILAGFGTIGIIKGSFAAAY